MVLLAASSVNVSVGVGTAGSARTTLSEKQTTGSITAGSDILTVADGSGLSVGDWVIIETGGEAGLGARGTEGVGGAWPALSYANATAMNADTSQPDNRACWLRDSGNVYHYDTGTTWTQVTNDYYLEKAIPKALTAQITARVGNKIKLDRNAVVSTTSANVYFDNWGILQDMAAASLTVNIPAGTYCTSCHVYVTGRAGITFSGAGQNSTILKTPNGAAHGGIDIRSSEGATVQDLQIDCSFRNDKYSMKWNDSRAAGISAPDLWSDSYRNASAWGMGTFFSSSSNSEILDVTIRNPGLHGISAQFCTDTWARRCSVYVDDAFITYTQWMIQWVDSTGGGVEDCLIDSDWLTSGYNAFKSRNVTFRRCQGRNAFVANNASDGCVFDEPDLLYEDAADGLSHISSNSGALEFSTNVGEGFNTNAAQVINPTIIQQGVPFDSNNTRAICLVITSSESCPVEVTGTYDTDPTTPKGLFDVQGSPTGTNSFEGLGIRSAGTLTVKGIRIKGSPPTGKTSMVHTEGGTLNITNSIFDASTPTGTATITASGNQTNAEYEA